MSPAAGTSGHLTMDQAWSDPTWDPLGSLEMDECNVCTASVEKRIRMQQAWQLWKAFMDTFHQYEDWLKSAEQKAAFPKSSHVLYTDAKEELKKFEVLHRQVQERLGQLESLNRQYWRLVTKGIPVDSKPYGTGLKARLRAMAQESNQRWDTLQKQISAVHRRLKVFEDERLSDRDSDLESGCSSDLEQDENQERMWGGVEYFNKGLHSSPQHSVKDPELRAAPARSGSMDLEWDPSVDVGGSTSHDEDDSSYFSTGTGKSGIWLWEEASRQRSNHCRQHPTSSPICARSKADAEVELQVLLDSVEICDERSDDRLRRSSRETIPCLSVGPLDSHRNEECPKNLPHEPGACCQAEHFTFDQERIESWLGQTRLEQRREVLRSQLAISQGSTQPDYCCPISPEGAELTLVQKCSNSYCHRRKNSSPRQLVPKPRPKQKLARKWKAGGTKEVTIAIEKGDSPLSFSPTEEELLALKRPHLFWLKTLDPKLVLLFLLLVALLLLLSLRETPCYKANHYAWSLHLMLKYINGPPPT
uniref:Uncharacterized protein LOC117365935 isoform X4 n=1 Tax=Geotrypetes seraphini TaxID=260995 RepID=A0A6P8S8G1_GEOSA|nr:uncharacterized protein LOC117365935 isoform X4 [Geotrypetes seraphini]